jgi:uncharacterized protein (DUF983 family)
MKKDKPSLFSNVCPRCHEGRVFRFFYSINRTCPVCDLRFEKEEGYFFGPMIISYFVTLLFALPVLLFLVFKMEAEAGTGMLAAGALIVVLGPIFYRYAKLIWLHLETRFDVSMQVEHERARKMASEQKNPGSTGTV